MCKFFRASYSGSNASSVGNDLKSKAVIAGFMVAIWFPQFAMAQLPMSARNSFASNSTLGQVAAGKVFWSQPPSVSRWERILSFPHNDAIVGEMDGTELINTLQEIGIPVTLDISASEDSFQESTRIQIPDLPKTSLYTRLNHALKRVNAIFTIVGNQPAIISLDDADSPLYFFTATYNVTQVAASKNAIIDAIQASVDTDSWMDTGTGEGSIHPILFNGQKLIVISQTYACHLKVRSLFQQLGNASSNRSGVGSTSVVLIPRSGIEAPVRSRRPRAGRQFAGATSVAIPGRSAPRRERSRSLDSGGVFNIPSGRQPQRGSFNSPGFLNPGY